MKIRDFLLQNKDIVKKVVIALLFAIFGVPFIINILFKIKAPFEIFDAEWYAEDALSYYGSVLAFLGTAAFSALALWQNHVFKEANDMHEKMLEDMEKARNMPVLCLSLRGMKNHNFFLMKLENKSENIASDINIEEAVIINFEGREIWRESNEHKMSFLINDKYEFLLSNEDFFDGNDIMKIKISFYDKYRKKHFCVFESYKEKNTHETPLLFRTKGIDIE